MREEWRYLAIGTEQRSERFVDIIRPQKSVGTPSLTEIVISDVATR